VPVRGSEHSTTSLSLSPPPPLLHFARRYDPQFGDLIGSGDDEIWEGGEAGGFECYIAADDDDEAVDEYNADDDSELLSVRAAFNTLSLCYRNYGTMRFVKYLSAAAPGSRVDVSVEFLCEEGEDEEEEGGEEEDEEEEEEE
jgi:hypothetical protein